MSEFKRWKSPVQRFREESVNIFSSINVPEFGEVFVWGYGLLGNGPKGTFSEQPVLLKPPLFGRNELQPNTTVIDVQCGLYHFAAITGTISVIL